MSNEEPHRQDTHHAPPFERLITIAKAAGDAIMDVYNSKTRWVQHKSDDSPVTNADLAAHRVLTSGLSELPMAFPVVSEEDPESLAHRQPKGKFWLIDPLDGTKEFIARNGEFTVNIALIDGGRSVLGLVYAPGTGIFYWGGAGLGAFTSESASVLVSSDLEPVPMRVAGPKVGARCRVLSSRSHSNERTQSLIDRLGDVDLVQAGSSLKFCRIAEGKADIYPRLAPTCEWDTAAAQAVLEGAGGVVVDLEGRQLRYGKANFVNPSFIATRDIGLIPS